MALNPSTPAAMLDDILGDLDHVLVMTVNPGFGGQKFIESTLAKIARVRQMMNERGLERDIEVDGGIGEATAPRVVQAGANLLVAGASVFASPDGVAAAMRRLRASWERCDVSRPEMFVIVNPVVGQRQDRPALGGHRRTAAHRRRAVRRRVHARAGPRHHSSRATPWRPATGRLSPSAAMARSTKSSTA